MKQCFFPKKIILCICIFFISVTVYSQQKPSQIPFVNNIQAIPINSQTIELSWNIPEQTSDKSIISFSIYRSSQPIININNLTSLEPIAKVKGSFISYRDKVPDDTDYYYAIIINATEQLEGQSSDTTKLYFDEEYDTILDDNSTACIIIVPGENATISSIHAQNSQIKLTQKPVNEEKKDTSHKRNIPVPYTYPFDTETDNSSDCKISDQSAEYANELIKDNQLTSLQPLEKYIFSEDFITPAGGEEYLLFEILIDSFTKEKYEESEYLLRKFLSQNRSETITQKALFYLGESLYFTGNYKKAIQTFLQVYEAYPNLVRKWIDSSLDYIK